MTTTTLERPPNDHVTLHLSGPEKAAILFLCLGEERGSELMKKLDEAEIHSITHAMTGLGMIPAEVVEGVMTEFGETVSQGGGVIGSYAAAQALLKNFLPDAQVADILHEAGGSPTARDMWRRFNTLDENIIANYLKGEHEQTAAAILSYAQPSVAARVLPLLGFELMHDITERMISMETVPLHMRRQIEEALQNDLMAETPLQTSADMQQRMADLFNRLDANLFDKLAPHLDESFPEAFGAIKQKMFVFEDLVKLDAQDLAQVFRGMAGNTLPLALRGVTKEMRDHFMAALPARSRDMLLEEMSTMGPVRGRDVRMAQQAMVDYAKELAEVDRIRLPSDSEDNELID